MFKKTVGQDGENLSAKFLRKNGYKIIKRNLRSRLGEIDILASKKNDIVIVEVKTKSGRNFGEGFEMVNYFKRRKLLSLAKEIQKEYSDKTIRIDVISVDLSEKNPQIRHFINAVEDD